MKTAHLYRAVSYPTARARLSLCRIARMTWPNGEWTIRHSTTVAPTNHAYTK